MSDMIEEKDGHFELPKELIDAFGEIVKQQEAQFRLCKTMLAGFKATKEKDIQYMDTYMDPLWEFMEQGSETEMLYLDYISHIATFNHHEAERYRDSLEEDLGYKSEIFYAAAYVARDICRKEKGEDGDEFFSTNCWRVGAKGHDWKIKTVGFLYHVVQDLGYDPWVILQMVKKKLEEWMDNSDDTFWMYDFEDELMPFAGKTCHPPTNEDWEEMNRALLLLNENTADNHDSYLARFPGQYLPIKVKLDDLEGQDPFLQDYKLILQMLWDYVDGAQMFQELLRPF